MCRIVQNQQHLSRIVRQLARDHYDLESLVHLFF
jgi:hypothetical protein